MNQDKHHIDMNREQIFQTAWKEFNFSARNIKKELRKFADRIMDLYEQDTEDWISVEDKPNKGKRILLSDGLYVWEGWLHTKEGNFMSMITSFKLRTPTHWMPLPKLPQQNEQVAGRKIHPTGDHHRKKGGE